MAIKNWRIAVIMKTLRFFFGNVYGFLASFLIKRNGDYICLGSWCGELYIDNSRYLAEYLLERHPEKHIVWVGNEKVRSLGPKEFHFVVLDSLRAVPVLLKCKYMFFTQMHRADISKYHVYRNAVLCLLEHGNPIKKWGMDDPNYDGQLEYENLSWWRKALARMCGENKKYSFMAVASVPTQRAFASALRYRLDASSRILLTGTPRNDYILNATDGEKARVRDLYAKLFGYDPTKRIVAYLPTFRRKTQRIESFANRDAQEMARLEELLKRHHAVLLEKNHFAADKFSVNSVAKESDEIIKVNVPINVQELQIITDIHISDYSGGFLDFALTDRPIIHYLYDYEEYRDHDSGLYYPAEDFAAGKVVATFDELLDELDRLLSGHDGFSESRKHVREKLLTFEDGKACEKIYREIMGH